MHLACGMNRRVEKRETHPMHVITLYLHTASSYPHRLSPPSVNDIKHLRPSACPQRAQSNLLPPYPLALIPTNHATGTQREIYV